MLKKYLEIIENLTEEESLEQQPRMLRIEVKDETEAIAQAEKYEPVFEGLNYEKRILTQNHYADSSRNQPCEVKKL